jgi:hypothetical protein
MERDKERRARVEALSRDINEKIEEAHEEDASHRTVQVICECSNLDCDRVVTVEVSEYERVRRDPRQFVLVPDHVESDIDRVVTDADGTS